MSVSPLDAPRPLPSVPCPVWDGHRVTWGPWRAVPRMTHVDPSCEACAFPGPLSDAVGMIEPLDGETVTDARIKRLRSGHEYGKEIQVPAHRYIGLRAILCPACHALDVLDDRCEAAPLILCDGCDAVCAVGATFEEARKVLVEQLGGWSAGGDADWDLCRACNPTVTADAPPRALAAFAASRARSSR